MCLTFKLSTLKILAKLSQASFFLAHLSTTCSGGAFGVVMCLSSTISINIFFSQTAGPSWTKPGRNVPCQAWQECSQNFIPSKTLVAMATNWNFLSNSLQNLLLWNRAKNMALVNGNLLALYGHEEFPTKSSSLETWVRFWNNFTECSLDELFQKFFVKFWSVHKQKESFLRISSCPYSAKSP